MGNMGKEVVIDNFEDIVIVYKTSEDVSTRNTASINNDIDTSDDSSEEDSDEEYMSDGEVVRKNKRGFKQLNNCKRFWKASLMIGNRK